MICSHIKHVLEFVKNTLIQFVKKLVFLHITTDTI